MRGRLHGSLFRSDLMRRICFLTVLVTCLYGRDCHGYVDSAPTLGGMCYAAPSVLLVRVKKVSLDHRAILYEPVTAIKGRLPDGLIRHSFQHEANPRSVLA